MTDTNGYKSLLPEITEILSTSVSFLKSRPDEVQEVLCKRYVDLWYCDTPAIKRELAETSAVRLVSAVASVVASAGAEVSTGHPQPQFRTENKLNRSFFRA